MLKILITADDTTTNGPIYKKMRDTLLIFNALFTLTFYRNLMTPHLSVRIYCF